MYYTRFQSPFGDIALTANNDGLTALSFLQAQASLTIPTDFEENQPLFDPVCQQLTEYFDGTRTEFQLALAPKGTDFQKKVWKTLTKIKCGSTQSYQWVANEINNHKAVRAVGMANGANPIALIVPCHRVIGSNGKLTGYAGGLALKAKLLMHEGAHFNL